MQWSARIFWIACLFWYLSFFFVVVLMKSPLIVNPESFDGKGPYGNETWACDNLSWGRDQDGLITCTFFDSVRQSAIETPFLMILSFFYPLILLKDFSFNEKVSFGVILRTLFTFPPLSIFGIYAAIFFTEKRFGKNIWRVICECKIPSRIRNLFHWDR
jgi:hypothetical protein